MKFEFNGYADFLEFVARDAKASDSLSRSCRLGVAWHGTKSFGEAMDLARNGWADGLAQMESIRASFDSILGDRVKRMVLSHSVMGFMPDVGAFCSGEVECMFNRDSTEVNAPGRIIRLVVNASISAAVDRETMLRRGAIVCALSDALEAAGYSVEIGIISTWTTMSQTVSHCASFCAKRAGEALDLDRLAFISGHVSFGRRLIFSAMEHDRQFDAAGGLGYYGMPAEASSDEQGDIYFGRMFTGEMDTDQLVQWTRAQLAKIGITFEE